MRSVKPWPAIGNDKFLSNIDGENRLIDSSHRAIISKLRNDLKSFSEKVDSVVVINLASTEKLAVEGNEILNSLAGFETALDDNSADISPAMLYAYAAIAERIPYGNFTPSVSVDIPALIEFAEKMDVPVAGKDGKTGQTFIKSVLAPAFRSRALRVMGWFSTNILGNRDGLSSFQLGFARFEDKNKK